MGWIKKIFLFIEKLIIETKYARASTRYYENKLSEEELINRYIELDAEYNKLLEKYGKKE